MEILVESAVRSTVLAAAAGLVVKALRLASPGTLHAVWAGVAVVMLLGPAIAAWGPEAAVPVLRTASSPGASDWEPHRVPVGTAATASRPSAPHRRGLDLARAVAFVYPVGVVLLLLRLALGVRRARTLIHEAAPVNGRLTHPRCTTPMTVGLLAPVVILPRDWPAWPHAQLAAVLAHEEAHVRRRDPLVAVVTLVNRAVFWFHPLAWWLHRRASSLAEQACDEAVIRQGHDAQVYSTSLLGFAKSVATAGRRVAFVGTGMSGGDLEARLRRLSRPPVAPPSTRRLAGLVAVCLAVVAVTSAATPRSSAAAMDPAPAESQAPGGGEWVTGSSERFDIFIERQLAGRMDEVKTQAEDAYAVVSGRLKYDLAVRVPLIVVRGDDYLRDGAVSANRLPGIAATEGRQRIVISTESLDTRAGALVHELTHQFAFEIIPRASAAAPGLVEGLAEHQRNLWAATDYRQMQDDVAAGRSPDLEAMTAAERPWAHALFDFIAATYADDGTRRFLFALRSRPSPAEAVPAAFNVPFGEFDRVFRAYVAARFGRR